MTGLAKALNWNDIITCLQLACMCGIVLWRFFSFSFSKTKSISKYLAAFLLTEVLSTSVSHCSLLLSHGWFLP